MKNRLRVWEKEALFLEQTGFVFEKKNVSVFGKDRLRFLGQTGSVWWKIGLGFLGRLGTKPKSHCFER